MKQLSHPIKILLFFIIFQNCLFIQNNTTISYEDFENPINNETNITNTTEIDYEHVPSYFIISYLSYIIQSFLPNQDPSALLKILNETDCFINYIDIYNETHDLSDIIKIIKYSGKSFPDFGDEKSCIEIAGNSFILFTIKYDVKSPSKYNGNFKLLPFISYGYSFYGLCVKDNSSCTNQLPHNITRQFNNISLSEVYEPDFLRYPDPRQSDRYKPSTLGQICYISVFVYIGLRVFITLIGFKYFKDSEKKKNNGKSNSSSSSSSDESDESDDENFENSKNEQTQNEENVLTQTLSKTVLTEDVNKLNHPKLYFIYKTFSIGVGLDNIIKNKGKLYNETDLYLIYFLRGISLALKTMNMNLNSIIYIPSTEINVHFFQSMIMIIAKMSSFSDVLFIMCEGIIFGYKLMSFIRKYNPKNDSPSFKLFINFFMRFIPSFSIVFSVFFFIYYFSDHYLHGLLGDIVYNQTKMQHFRKNIIDCRDCMNKTRKVFEELIPFHMQYHKNNNTQDDFQCCFQFIVVFTNFFYCFLIILLLTFISFKVKKKLYDYFILLILIVNIVVSFIPLEMIFQDIVEKGYFNIKILLGEYYTIKYTHLFFNFYALGFFVGLAIFYNNDLTRTNSMDKTKIYKPFPFCSIFIKFFYLRSVVFNIILIVIFSLISISLFSTFWILTYFYVGKNHELTFDLNSLNSYLTFSFRNEKNIFAICSVFLIILICCFKKDDSLNIVFSNRVVSLFNRIGYSYYASLEFFIYLFYCLGNLDVQLNAFNIFYITCGFIFLLTFINVFNVVIFEIPWRAICKKSFKLEPVEKEIDNI